MVITKQTGKKNWKIRKKSPQKKRKTLQKKQEKKIIVILEEDSVHPNGLRHAFQKKVNYSQVPLKINSTERILARIVWICRGNNQPLPGSGPKRFNF